MGLIYQLSFLFVVIIVMVSKQWAVGVSVSTVRLGDNCASDTSICGQIPDAECRSDGTTQLCKCKKGYVGIDGKQKCYFVELGSDCSFYNGFMCDEIPNAECEWRTGLCTCKNGYTGSGKTTCSEDVGGLGDL